MESERADLRRGLVWAAGATVMLVLAVGCSHSGQMTPGAKDPAGDPWNAPQSWAEKKNPVPADADAVAAGKKLYEQNCAVCHGADGKGNGPAAAGLSPQPADFASASVAKESDGALFWKITEGHSPMPSFRSSLSDTQRWQLVDYIRTFEKKS